MWGDMCELKRKRKRKTHKRISWKSSEALKTPEFFPRPCYQRRFLSSSSLEGCYLQRLSEGLWSGRQTSGISESYIKYREIMEGYILNNAISISLSSPTYQPSIIQISLLPTSHKHEIELFEETEQTERLHIWTFPQWHGLPTLSTMC